MPSTLYKGFEIFYQVAVLPDHIYQAEGYVIPPDKTKIHDAHKFQTEHHNQTQAKKEILSLIKNYIDFELSQAK